MRNFTICAAAVLLAGCGAAGTGPTVSTVMAPSKTTSTRPDVPLTSPEATAAAQRVWKGLDGSTNSCEEFDYWPTGGMMIFACHIWSIADEASLRALAPMPIFLSGPHADRLVLDDARQFGHYNPEFVTWFVAHAVPGAEDEAFRAMSQPIYSAYVRFLAEIYLAAYEKTRAEPGCFASERDAYAAHLERGTLPGYYYERWFWWLNPGFCKDPDGGFNAFSADDGGMDGNVTKSAMGFWVRRSLDGTMEAWHEGLLKLTRTYP
jgi:hypothetical protein